MWSEIKTEIICFVIDFYRPHPKDGEGNSFTLFVSSHGGGYPGQVLMGGTPVRSRWGVPPPPPIGQQWSTGYMAGGMLLRSRRRTFLFSITYFTENTCSNFKGAMIIFLLWFRICALYFRLTPLQYNKYMLMNYSWGSDVRASIYGCNHWSDYNNRGELQSFGQVA